MRRYVQYHADGSVRMDFHTFRKMPVEKIMSTLKAHTVVRAPRNPHALAKGTGVKQYA